MTDPNAINPDRSRIMRAVRKVDTKPELIVRRTLHAMGFRFRLHRRDLPGTPDVVLPRYRTIVQVHGCFWHQHEGCRSATVPATRQDYWLPKLSRNKERDRRTGVALEALGWRVTTVWECEATDLARLAPRLRRFLGRVRPRPARLDISTIKAGQGARHPLDQTVGLAAPRKSSRTP